MNVHRGSRLRYATKAGAIALMLGMVSAAQDQPPAANRGDVGASLVELQSEVHELKNLVQQLKQEATASRAEISRLREELELDRSTQPPAAEQPSQVDERIGHLEEEQLLLTGKVNEQYQTKVESASKYRVRFSGIALFNLFSNQGTVDNIDVPNLAYLTSQNPSSSGGSFGGTLRQSIFGFEVFGPQWMGARISGSANFDVGGGFPWISNGVNSGLVRLRTATLRLDWKDTDVVVGQDQLFFQPNSPTSFASLIVPALSYAGNLWAWTPQVHVEHRFTLTEKSTLTLQAGLLDPLTGELPDDNYTWFRQPQAGESAQQPAYALRLAYSHPLLGHTLTIGAAGYYSREDWGFDRDVNGYAALADWNLPLSQKFALSGSFYRGQAIGGLGGGIGRSVLWNGPLSDPTSNVIPLNAVGGWTQLKYRATPKLEFNAAFGEDNSFAQDLRVFSEPHSYLDPTITRNQSVFGNVIYRPRSDVLFSLEYRRIKTFSIYDFNADAGQVNLGMGILF